MQGRCLDRIGGKALCRYPSGAALAVEILPRLVNVSARTVKTPKALKKSDAGLYSAVIRSC
jgi:hypothetical protein